jgi:hypothetical protein
VWLPVIAQAGLPENPLGYGILGLIVVLQREIERGDKWEATAAKKDETIATQAETIRELTEIGNLLRTVIEGLPKEGPSTAPRRRTS